MKPCLIAIFFTLLLVYSCKRHSNITADKVVVKTDTVNKNKLKKDTSKKLIPVLGYRFKITGDFDGDGKKETLTEHFVNRKDHKETNKFYENADYDSLVTLNSKRWTISFLSCDNKLIPNLITDKGGALGLAYLKNEGDLDGDGADEISYVIDEPDWSNVNFCVIMTCKNHKWKTLFVFVIRDWQLPDLPQTYNQYGIGGLENKIINTEDTAANRKIEKNLNDFKGLIKKLANYKLQIVGSFNLATKDTMIVDIRKHHIQE